MTRTIGNIPDSGKKDVDLTQRTIQVLEELLEKMPNATKFNIAVSHALDYVLEMDLGFVAAMTKLEASDIRDIIVIEDDYWLNTLRSKLSKLLTCKLLINAVGLVAYEQQIMNRMIEATFKIVDKSDK